MSENQRTISEWATKTFGTPTLERSIERMLEEVDELKEQVKEDVEDFEKISNECADIYITMCQVADVYGFDLHMCVDHKMDINRHREWKKKGDGTGYHVK